MHNLNPEQKALLLLSWGSKITSLLEEDKKDATLKTQLAAQKSAQKMYWAYCESEVKNAGQELQQLLKEKEAFAQQLQSDPENERVQESYKVTIEEIDHFRDQIKQFNSILNANTPEDIGGIVDLPLEKYREKLGFHFKESPYGMEDVYTVLIGLVVGTLGVLALLYMFLWSKEVTIEVLPSDISTGRVLVRVYNDVSKPVAIIAPLDSFPENSRDVSYYGLTLYVREKGEDKYQLISPPDDAWTYQGTPTRKMDPIKIAPKLNVELSLSLKALEKNHPKLDGYRIIGETQNGFEILRFEQSFRW